MKTQKGITLIALIITIIVMLILVGVSVTVALNTGIFKAAQGAAKNTQLASEEETELSNGTTNIEGTGEIGIDDYVASLKGEEGGDWELTTDSGTTGLSVGDLVTHKEKTTEQFYVISVTGNTVAMLAAKNITKTEPLKQSDSAPNVAFSAINYWGADDEISYETDDNTHIYPDLNKYTDKTDAVKTSMGVVSTDAIEIARAYGNTFGVTGRLLTVEDVVALGGRMPGNDSSGCPDFINTQNYWLGSASYYETVFSVLGPDCYIYSQTFEGEFGCGVRPVVEISKSDI